MIETRPDFYDFVIVGAGPAGLSAGITARKKGLTAVVLEKGYIAGPRPRGEGVNAYPLFDDLLGAGFVKGNAVRMDGSMVFHSPGDLKTARRPGKKELFFFKWRFFMDRLKAVSEARGVRLLFDSTVVEPIENSDGICCGVRYRDSSGSLKEIHGNVVMGCDGHQSVIGAHYGVDYGRLNCMMVKCIARNANIDINQTPELRFYLIGNGDLSYAPDFPPCVVYGFPIGGRKMELGLMLRMRHGNRMRATVTNPDKKTFFRVWKRLKAEYPGFSAYFKGAQITVEEVTALTNAAMVERVVPAKGLVLAGDSAGFVDPFGSSGIYFGMAMAAFWADMLSEEIKKGRGTKMMSAPADGLWRNGKIAVYHKAFRKTSIYRHIKRSYFKTGLFEWYIFKHLRTAGKINRRWKVIQWMLKMAG